MKTTPRIIGLLLCVALGALLLLPACSTLAADKLKAVIIDGQNNHGWQATTPILKAAALESSGRFTVDVATTPPHAQSMEDFKPEFSKYDVVVLNYNGDDWSEPTKKAFEDYMKNGGGMVSYHAADNSFPHWAEFNKMIGVGGWGGRNANSGSMLRWRDGKVVRDTGGGGWHAWEAFGLGMSKRANRSIPIMKGSPDKWLHTAG